MELELRYFKCHDKYKLTISKGTTLIKGPSGKGKSSIFEAITWLLYGTTREIDPWTNGTAKTKVTMKYNGMKIVRSKRPNRLLLTMPEGTYEDAVAQDIIEGIFNSKSIWECTGYIDEDAKNTFPYMTPKERLNTLMCLIYPTDNPEEEIQKIKYSIEASKKDYEASEAVYNSYKRDYDKFWKKNSKDITSIQQDGVPQYTIDELEDISAKYNKELIALREIETRQRVNIERLATIETEIIRLDSILSEVIDIPSLQTELATAIKRESLERNRYFTLEVDINKFTEDDYNDAVEQERSYSKYIRMIKKYNILDYYAELEDLKDRIRNSNTDFYPLLKRKEELKRRINTPRCPPENTYTWDDVINARDYETTEKHNANILRDMNKYNVTIPILEVERLVSNESNYALLRRKRSLEKQISSLGNVVKPEHSFAYDEYYEVQKVERKRMVIEKEKLSKDHFASINDIEEAYNVYIQYGDITDSQFTEQDLLNAQVLEDYYRAYGTKDYNTLTQSIAKAKIYHKFIDHIALYETYGSKALSSILVNKQEIDKLRNELIEIETRAEVLKCPHCDKEVHLRDQKLVKASKNYTQQQIDDLKRKYQESLLYYEIGEKKKNLTSFPNIGKITEYCNYKSVYRGDKYLEEPAYIAHGSDKISKILEFQAAYNNLSEKGKKYYTVSSNIYKYLLQLDTYCETPNYSSEYMKRCIDEAKKYEEYITLKRELDNIDVPDLPDQVEDINKLKSYLNLHRRLKEISSKPLDTSSNMERCIREQEEYQKYKEAKDEYDSIIIPSGLIISNEELESLKNKLRDLESVNVVEVPNYSSQYIRDSIEKSKIMSELAELSVKRDSKIIKKELDKQVSIQRQQDAAIIMKEKLMNEKTIIVIDDSLQNKIDEVDESIKSYEDEIWVTNLYQEYLKHKNKLDEVEKERSLSIKNYTKDEELLREAIDTVHQKLTSLLSSVNYCIEKILRDIFLDPIEVRLKTFKQLKTKDILRPEINIDIKYRGGSINNIKKVSKGERYRIILAITLALNEVSRLPILLMDETLAHIDQDLKENVTNTLKNYSRNKSLIIIAHDVIEGLYDHVEDLS